ncbi:MAG: hypothetical protein O8C64_04130 [Candidatus Methanoperedens sp.]|nr:hypothetical protein [Candidatus Methanoperedens sp.]
MAPEIPLELQYEELLPHIFPGFFAAITSFMLIDFMSPFNFTSWATKSLEGLAGLVGFIVLFGSILGVILDSIHHLVIEDAIFNNLREVKKINILIKELYPEEEQEHLTHHYFIKNIDDVNIEESIVKDYYRFTEFYANTFSSLLLFSLIVPFYLFYVLKVSWISSMFVAFMSFIFAITCLYKSCDSYKKFLRAKYSIILAHLNNFKKNPAAKWSIKKDCLWASFIIKCLFVGVIALFVWFKFDFNIFFLTFLGIGLMIILLIYFFVIPYFRIGGEYLFNWGEIPGNDDDQLKRYLIRNFGVDWVRGAEFKKKGEDKDTIEAKKDCCNDNISLKRKNDKVILTINGFEKEKFDVRKEIFNLNIYPQNENKERKNTEKILKGEFTLSITLIFMLFILYVFLLYFTPPQIIIEPKNFEEELTSGNRTIQLSIKNIGADLTNVKLNITGINGWLSLNPGNFYILKNNDVQFIQANLTIPENETVGEYSGVITIHAMTYGKNFIEPLIAELIPDSIPEIKFIIRIK